MDFFYLQEVVNYLLKIPLSAKSCIPMTNHSTKFLSIPDVSPQGKIAELVLSHIDFDHRDEVWLLRAQFNDREGLLKEINQFLSNSLIMPPLQTKACTVFVHNTKVLRLEVLLDSRHFHLMINNNPKSTEPIHKLGIKAFKLIMVSHFIKDIRFSTELEEPEIVIEKNYHLCTPRDGGLIQEIQMEGCGFKIPTSMCEKIIATLAPAGKPGEKKLLASVVCDAYDNLLRFFLFYEGTGVLHVRIKCQNKPGAEAVVTNVLEKGRFNIEQYYTRPLHLKSRMGYLLIDCILSLPDAIAASYTSDTDIIEQLISGPLESITSPGNDFSFTVTKPRMQKDWDFTFSM